MVGSHDDPDLGEVPGEVGIFGDAPRADFLRHDEVRHWLLPPLCAPSFSTLTCREARRAQRVRRRTRQPVVAEPRIVVEEEVVVA